MLYVLILTILMNRAGAMTNISGFETLSACQSAGAAWMLNAKELNNGFDPQFTCVPYQLNDKGVK